MRTTINTILVANRGEIAVRIMRTCRSLGIRTVAVYSDADADAPHVQVADDAVRLGPAPVAESYLAIDRVLEAAAASGADAVHPGYGFLSENAAFAEACATAGLTFIGPPAGSISVMGDKAVSKRAMIEAGVPCIPGYQGEDQSDSRLIEEARAVGFPLMVKAAAGGGGRGMRLVQDADYLETAISLARSEAENAFGSGELILERAITKPRHVEIQVFADQHGHTIHLGERDCSVQRRHQKVVEESPCPVMTDDLREQMGTAAVAAAQAVQYVGAGTVEFLLDTSGQFFFLEMNTRLQVEHPVTEMVTGLDLVALQISVARGNPLPHQQSDITLNGHAIEVRLYAEDPTEDFLPSTGPVLHWQPASLPGIRVDSGVASGGEVSPFYDSMVAKIIAQGENRDEARQRLITALRRSVLFGTRTNRDFLLDVLEHSTFANRAATTAFIGEVWPGGYPGRSLSKTDLAVAAVLQYQLDLDRALDQSLGVNSELLEWSSTGQLTSVYRYVVDGTATQFRIKVTAPHAYSVTAVAQGSEPHTTEVRVAALAQHEAHITLNGRQRYVQFVAENSHTLHIAIEGSAQFVARYLAAAGSSDDLAGDPGQVLAPMHGALIQLDVAVGTIVKAGDRLAILEAMKMQHQIRTSVDGRVIAVHAAVGDQVTADEVLIEIEQDDPDSEAAS